MNASISSVVVLAAGRGKRMNTELPKVLHRVCGRTMLEHVLEAARAVGAERTILVLGPLHKQVLPYVPQGCEVALQLEQRGTGHAVLSAEDKIPDGDMLVLPGDTPLITGEALAALVREHQASNAVATVLTMKLDDPTGYGRIVRFPDGSVARIVEDRDATEAELAIREVNSGMYILPAPLALEILHTVGTDNDQAEYYLTDVVAGLRRWGERVAASLVSDPQLVLGVNTPVELAGAEALLGQRIKTRWMEEGVILIDPASTTIEAGATLAPDVVVRPYTTVAGATTVEKGCDIGPCSTLVDTHVGPDSVLPHCYVRSAVLEPGTCLPPFTYMDVSPETLS